MEKETGDKQPLLTRKCSSCCAFFFRSNVSLSEGAASKQENPFLQNANGGGSSGDGSSQKTLLDLTDNRDYLQASWLSPCSGAGARKQP
eukprot:5130232-Amphidinium_carterae.1